MKLKSIFVSMFALAALASCSNDDEMNPSGGIDVNGQKAYMALSVVMPNASGTRAFGGGNEEPGDLVEQTVTNVLLAMFDDNDVLLETKTLNAGDYKLKVGGTTTPEGSWDAILVNAETKKILTVINPTSTFTNACQKGVSWSVINSAKEQTAAEIATDDNFMMINAGDNANPANGALVEAKVKVVDGTVIVNEEAARAAAKKDPSDVDVDRVASKVTLKEKNGGATVANKAACEFGVWALNVTNKTMFPYSEIVMPAGGTTGKDYRIDPNYVLGTFHTNQFNYLKVSATGELPADFTVAANKYCLENTMDANAQTQAQTTTAVTQAVYTPEGFTKGHDWFRLLGVTYKTFDDLKAAYNDAGATAQLKQLCDEFYEHMKAAPGGHVTAADFASLTSAELQAIPNGGEYSKPKHPQTVGVEYFQKGICYYGILIRHDEAITGNMAHGKYGVVRNNWYTLTINTVSQPGTPWLPDPTDPTDPTDPGTPDDPKEAALGVTIKVNPWTTWSQGVDL